MTSIYLTSTLKNSWNLNFNPRIVKALEKYGISCFLPQRDTNQNETSKNKSKQDLAGIKNAKKILAIALNESPNFGVEIGYAYSANLPIILLTDESHQLPMLIEYMASEIIRVKNLDDIESYIQIIVNNLK